MAIWYFRNLIINTVRRNGVVSRVLVHRRERYTCARLVLLIANILRHAGIRRINLCPSFRSGIGSNSSKPAHGYGADDRTFGAIYLSIKIDPAAEWTCVRACSILCVWSSGTYCCFTGSIHCILMHTMLFITKRACALAYRKGGNLCKCLSRERERKRPILWSFPSHRTSQTLPRMHFNVINRKPHLHSQIGKTSRSSQGVSRETEREREMRHQNAGPAASGFLRPTGKLICVPDAFQWVLIDASGLWYYNLIYNISSTCINYCIEFEYYRTICLLLGFELRYRKHNYPVFTVNP